MTNMMRKETKGREEGNLSCFSNSESAAATAIAAVLLLALAFTMISVIKLEYVPEWKNDAERGYMYDTLDDMAGVKTSIDILSRLMELNNSSNYNISVTVPVDLGGGQIPFLEPSKSDGKLSVNTERCAMTIVPNRPALKIEPDNFTIECGGITCYSENRQYPNQIFRYENGALILANDESSVMRQQPVLIIEKNETNESNCTIRIHAIQLSGKRDSTSSNTVIPLQLTGYKTEPVYDSDDDKNTNRSINAFNMTISTRYPDAWITYFKETAQDQGLNGTDYTVQYLRGSGHVRFSFLPNSNKTLERLCVNKTIIGVELGTESSFNYDHSTSWSGNMKKPYYFNTVSSTEVNLSLLEDYGSEVNFSTQSRGELLDTYSPSSNCSLNLKNPLDLTFGFDNSTKLEPYSPSSVTLIMIYQPTFSNPTYQSMTIADKTLPLLNGTVQDKWYLYDQTTTNISITDPSNLTFNLKIGSAGGNGNKRINIDYLAVRLN